MRTARALAFATDWRGATDQPLKAYGPGYPGLSARLSNDGAAGPATSSEMTQILTRDEIEAILPHRPPFLLIDEVVELEPGKHVVARKTVREEDCEGHFPGNPIMPGVLMVEALAQTGAVAVLSQEENRGKLALFAGIDDVRFKRVVRPGEQLELRCELETVRGPIGRGKARATVDGALAVRGTLTFAVEQ